jgi:vitamin K-dependent gamma-carboxylase
MPQVAKAIVPARIRHNVISDARRIEELPGRAPVSAASLAVFRMLFGAVAVFGAGRFLWQGWVDKLYLEPAHHLTYPWFDWVQPMPGPLMHLHVALLAVLGLCITLGYRYRVAMALYAVAFTYVELIDAALYLNHYWFVTIASFVLIFVPLNTMWSLDARSGRIATPGSVPAWCVWIVRAQLAVVYVFAGIAKLQSDWLLRAEPMRTWLADRTNVPVLGPFLDDAWIAFAFSWAGAFFDCTIVFWLLWNRSRPFAYTVLVAFHLATAVLFPQIGVFPWLMILSTLVFFPPNWPLRLGHPGEGVSRTRCHPGEGVSRTSGTQWQSSRTEPLGPGSASEALVRDDRSANEALVRDYKGRRTFVLLTALALVQLAVPLRHLAYPGDVRWTEEGYYGAWRVMLTEKGGSLVFNVNDPGSGEQWRVDPTHVLTDWQARQAAVRADLLLTTAHLIADDFADRGHPNVQVRAESFVSFNGRPNQRMVDPTVDLAAVSRGPGHKSFILPLEPAVRS